MSETPRAVHPAPDLSLGERLRAKRQARGLSQRQLASEFEVTQQTIAAWEKGGRPESKYFDELADLLELRDAEAVVDLLDAHRASRPSPEAAIQGMSLAGRSPEEIIDAITEAAVRLATSGAGITDAQTRFFTKLIDHYEGRKSAK